MIEGTRLIIFLSAAAILALTPGPGIFYVLGRTLHGGRREGISSALGTLAGGFIHVFAAALGLSLILMSSAVAFESARIAGACYLVYLGVLMIRNRRAIVAARDEVGRSPHSFVQGVVTEVLNPKTALFFLSFIPQFVVPAKGHITVQFLILGAISVGLNTAVDLAAVALAAAIARRLTRNPKFIERQRTASGLGMIGLGVYVAASR